MGLWYYYVFSIDVSPAWDILNDFLRHTWSHQLFQYSGWWSSDWPRWTLFRSDINIAIPIWKVFSWRIFWIYSHSTSACQTNSFTVVFCYFSVIYLPPFCLECCVLQLFPFPLQNFNSLSDVRTIVIFHYFSTQVEPFLQFFELFLFLCQVGLEHLDNNNNNNRLAKCTGPSGFPDELLVGWGAEVVICVGQSSPSLKLFPARYYLKQDPSSTHTCSSLIWPWTSVRSDPTTENFSSSVTWSCFTACSHSTNLFVRCLVAASMILKKKDRSVESHNLSNWSGGVWVGLGVLVRTRGWRTLPSCPLCFLLLDSFVCSDY